MSDAPTPTAEPEVKTSLEVRLGTKPQKPGLLHRIASVWKDEYDTAVNWPRGIRHLMTRAIAVLIVSIIGLLAVGWLLNGIHFTGNFWENVASAALVALVAGGITFVVRPIIFVALQINSVIITAVLTIIFMGLTLLIAGAVVPGIQIEI